MLIHVGLFAIFLVLSNSYQHEMRMLLP